MAVQEGAEVGRGGVGVSAMIREGMQLHTPGSTCSREMEEAFSSSDYVCEYLADKELGLVGLLETPPSSPRLPLSHHQGEGWAWGTGELPRRQNWAYKRCLLPKNPWRPSPAKGYSGHYRSWSRSQTLEAT